jgi:predicted RecB family nuclease
VEGYWASLVYCYLAGSGVDIIAEDVTNTGRIDLTIKVNNNIYILEFKTTNEDPLKQIKEKRYYEKYLNPTSQPLNPNIYLVGITFDEESRNIKEFVWEKIEK